MVAVPDRLRALVTAELQEENRTLHVELPAELVERGALDPNDVYQIAVLEATESSNVRGTNITSSTGHTDPEPPVEEGEIRTVTIETLGDQGDGITRVERGYVVIVSDTAPGDEVVIEIESVQQNVAFASVVEQVEST